jgi:Sec-independent protein translocase protein TatA
VGEKRAVATLLVFFPSRLLRLARSTGDLTRKARAVRQWANGCEQSIVKHARLQQAARRFERTRERLQMATALGAMNAAQVMVSDGPWSPLIGAEGTIHAAQATVNSELLYLRECL